ncbi:hypothetical protein KBC86_03710 [Candidatus Gracilibacteria bacterium]|nr:hypothetical protein [Candidatus Gracilibacteria bacterium]
MSVYFIDTQARELFVEGLVEVLSMIFSVETDEDRALLGQELSELSDEELVRKQELVETYADTIMKLKNDHLIKVQKIGNEFAEKNERESVSLNLNFS